MKTKVAYFCMEFALEGDMPNYAGGLGVLAADIFHGMADKNFPAVGVSLIYHQGYDKENRFDPEKYMKKLPQTVTIKIEHRDVTIGAYQYDVIGSGGAIVPIYFLTTDLPENKSWDKDLTRYLYASETYTRFGQEAILGIGGLRMLRELGYNEVDYLHMNEGHSAFLTLELLREVDYDDSKVRSKCAFTTHTPVKAGHDHFSYDLSYQILGKEMPWHIKDLATPEMLSMTDLAINLSHKTNSVSKRHQEVCAEMFPGKEFENITNGVHHLTWISDSMGELFDKELPGWKDHPEVFEKAEKSLTTEALVAAKKKEKSAFIKWINSHKEFFSYGSDMMKEDFFDEDTLTFVFARRFVSYKRPALIFRLRERLRLLGYKKIQIIFAGKCHPNDGFCNGKIQEIRHEARRLRGQIRVAVIPDYNIDIAKKLVAGTDVWLNNPIKPREASGTSGMKASLNGGLNCSILDGWWIEAYANKPKAGWGFGEKSDELDEAIRDDVDAGELCTILEDVIDCYYEKPEEWAERMKTAISLISFFNTYRCVDEYDKIMWSE